MKQIKNITIVGGGSAAWLGAAYLMNNKWDLKLTVIDKEIGNPIGVGEATVLTFPHFLRECGLQLTDWFAKIDTTYKTGINFPKWRDPKGNGVWHPFYLNRSYFDKQCTQYDLWAHSKQDMDFRTAALPTYNTVMNGKVDMWGSFETLAYHIDAGKLVTQLQKFCHGKVDVIKSDVVGVNRDSSGNVESVELKNGHIHSSDLFVDCTGFASILKESDRVELLGEGRLFTNCAVAGHVPYEDVDKERVPYVNCPAVEHGWIWEIPTQSRFGSGMVFNKDITDIDTAKQYFCDHWNGRIKPEDLKVIDWVPYYSKNFWENNVVSIGLSGGFIEPLESTGLASMTTGFEKLLARISHNAYSEADVEGYNNEMIYWYEDAVDFVNSHYSDTKWDTPFWNYVKETHVKSDKHLYYEEWLKDPNRKFYTSVVSKTLFHPPNWHLWLIQMGYPVNKDLNYLNPMEIEFMMREFHLAEEVRYLSSIPHSDAIESTNVGCDWWQRGHRSGDKLI